LKQGFIIVENINTSVEQVENLYKEKLFALGGHLESFNMFIIGNGF